MKRLDLRALLPCGASVVLYALALHVAGPLVAIALTPAIVVFATLKRDRDVALLSLVTGIFAAFFVQHTLWVASLPGTVVLSLYQGFIWIPMAFAIRFARNRWRIPLAVSWPFVWCAGEVLRSLGPLGTLFGTLAVPQTTQLWMLQIVDLGGASVVAFPLAALQGWFADIFLAWRRSDAMGLSRLRGIWQRHVKAGTAFVFLIWGFAGTYGSIRISQMERRMQAGPELGVVATDVLTLPSGESSYDEALLLRKLQSLSEALVEESPEVELIVWPEGMLGTSIPNLAFVETDFEPRMAEVIAGKTGLSVADRSLEAHWNQMRETARIRHQEFQAWIDDLGVPVLVGMDTWLPAPAEREEPFLSQNSAVLFTPGVGQHNHLQAKGRLYPLGEYLPFRDTFLAPFVQFCLGPSRANYHAGTRRFRYSIGDAGPRYAVALCSELKFDHLRGLGLDSDDNSKPFEMLVNIANEGLFQRNGMPEIFAFCASLRAIENRVTVVRSSNSGISGFWSPTGKPYGTVKNAKGQMQTSKGAVELKAVQAVMDFRRQHAQELLTNPVRRDELTCLINQAEQIRSTVAVEGYSSQRVFWMPEKTFFNRYGHLVKAVLIGVLVMLNLVDGLGRTSFSRRSSHIG